MEIKRYFKVYQMIENFLNKYVCISVSLDLASIKVFYSAVMR